MVVVYTNFTGAVTVHNPTDNLDNLRIYTKDIVVIFQLSVCRYARYTPIYNRGFIRLHSLF